LGLDLSFCNKK